MGEQDKEGQRGKLLANTEACHREHELRRVLAMEKEPEQPAIFTEPMPPPITDDTPRIPLGTNTGTEYAILEWGGRGPCLCSKHRAGAWVFLEEMSVVGILGLLRGAHDGRYRLDEWAAHDSGTPDADAIRDGVAQAFAEMSDQIYNAVSEAVFSHLQKNGIQCPKSRG